ncbi:MAG: hypothetical protein Q4A64_05025 [Porphyromonadaceae bacterium]|nr:hypothetical protein [Porphyromonadaceae bacterium]
MIKINHDNKEELAKEFAERIMTSVQNSNHYKEWSKKQEVRRHINQLNERVEAIYKSPQASYEEAIKALKDLLPNHQVNKKYRIKIGGKHKKITISDVYFNYEIINNNVPNDHSLEGRMSHAIWLTEKLGVTVCPYCNRDYIFTRDIKGGSGRCHLDHHIPQTKEPFLALSFYNLIPSCGVCNVLKKKEKFSMDPHEEGLTERGYHFFFKNIIGNILSNADIRIDEAKEGLLLEFNGSISMDPDLTQQIERLDILPMYAQHTAEAKELIFKARAYQEDYYESLIESFGGMGLDEGGMHRMIFGDYPDPEDFGKRPLAKFTYDLLQQLGVKQPKQ